MNRALLLDRVCAYYGMSQILHDVCLEVERGTVACLLGLNGMGKTTMLRAIMGLVDRIEGRLMLDGQELTGPTYMRSRLGVTLVPEDRKVFPNLTVHENMEVAQRPGAAGKDFHLDDATTLFPRLKERLSQKAGTLSGGEQQMLVVARALLANPLYMLLDEPTEGLAPGYVDAIRESIVEARRRDIGIVLVEQSLPLAMTVGDHFHVMENGQIEFSETREKVLADPALLESKMLVEGA